MEKHWIILRSWVQWHSDSIICQEVNLSLPKYRAFPLPKQQDIISLYESWQQKKIVVVQQGVGFKLFCPAKGWELTGSHQDQCLVAGKKRGAKKFICKQATFVIRIFLPPWSLHVFIVKLAFVCGILCCYSPAFLPSSRKASKQNTSFTELLLPSSSAEVKLLWLTLKMPSKIQGKLLSSLCILAGNRQACSLPGISARWEMEMLTWQIPVSAQEENWSKSKGHP